MRLSARQHAAGLLAASLITLVLFVAIPLLRRPLAGGKDVARPQPVETLTWTPAPVPPEPVALPETRPPEANLPEPPEASRPVRTLPLPAPELAGSNLPELPLFDPEGLRLPSPARRMPEIVPLARDVESVDERPRARVDPAPVYPLAARSRRIEGRVEAAYTVGVDGRVSRIEWLETSPPGVFEEAVRRALERARFAPARHAGRLVPVRVRQTFRFSLR